MCRNKALKISQRDNKVYIFTLHTINIPSMFTAYILYLFTSFVLAARAGLLFQLPVYVLFWSLEKCYPEGLLALDGKICLLLFFSFLQLNSSSHPCLLPTPPSRCISLSLSFLLLCLSHFLSPALSFPHRSSLSHISLSSQISLVTCCFCFFSRFLSLF